MKKLLLYCLLSMFVVGVYAQSSKDTLLTVTLGDTLKNKSRSISIKFGNGLDNNDDEKKSKPVSKVTFRFISSNRKDKFSSCISVGTKFKIFESKRYTFFA